MRAGRTLTSHFQLETRQHDLLGLDLGEGPPRRALIFGAMVFVVWVLLCAPLLGAPTQNTFSLYVIHEPVILTTAMVLPVSQAWTVAAISPLLAVAAAHVFHRYVEAPSVRWSKSAGSAVAR